MSPRSSSFVSASSIIRSPLASYSRLTPRDRVLLDLLDEHQTLLADQIQRALFTNRRTCQLRLDVLRQLQFVDRFRFAGPRGGTEPWRWVLGLAGARFQAAATGRPLPTERAHGESMARLSANPALQHLISSNEFFVRLHHAGRARTETTTSVGAISVTGASTDPEISGDLSGEFAGPVVLQRWWSERRATTRFSQIAPDGHGIWTAGGSSVGFFLECDYGTENLARLRTKLTGYARLAHSGGPTYPVLFWLPAPEREANLRAYLRGETFGVPVATAVHEVDPAGRVWMPTDGWQRCYLHELPADHGPDSANNANWVEGQFDLGAQRPAGR